MTMTTNDQRGEASDARDRTAASATEMRFGHERGTTRARKGYKKGTKRAWFGYGLYGRENRNHPLPQHLRRREKVVSAPAPFHVSRAQWAEQLQNEPTTPPHRFKPGSPSPRAHAHPSA